LALEYIHSRGVVFRDLKPENVMLMADGYIKVFFLNPEKIEGKNYKKSR